MMKVELEEGDGRTSFLFIQASRKGNHFRADALQATLKETGYDASFGYCLHIVETGLPVVLGELPHADT